MPFVSRLLVLLTTWSLAPAASACPWCRDAVEAAVVTPAALPTAALLWLPLLLVAGLGAALYHRS